MTDDFRGHLGPWDQRLPDDDSTFSVDEPDLIQLNRGSHITF